MECDDLASYRPFVSSRLFAQRELNRVTRYQRPAWAAVYAALSDAAPANIEDLKALFLDQIAGAKQQIRQSNSDMYRVYRNGAKPPRPRDEPYCRDRLLEFLRDRLQPMSAWVEPEGDMAADKSADIVVYAPNNLKLPVEVKRDYHPELWNAAKDQLERLYARDPQALGYRVYVVFYFGPERGRSMTAHPSGHDIPESAEALEAALNAWVPPEHQNRITCVVVDVTPPALPASKTRLAAGSTTKRTAKTDKRTKRSQPPSKKATASRSATKKRRITS
jgi:hypothetical protein